MNHHIGNTFFRRRYQAAVQRYNPFLRLARAPSGLHGPYPECRIWDMIFPELFIRPCNQTLKYGYLIRFQPFSHQQLLCKQI